MDEPTEQEIQSARELGFVSHAAISGVPADKIDSTLDSYRSDYQERDQRLSGIRQEVLNQKKAGASAPAA